MIDHVGADEIIYEMKENGHFLMSESTLAVYQNAYFQGIFPRISLEKWEELGNPRMEQLLRDRTVEFLSNQEAPKIMIQSPPRRRIPHLLHAPWFMLFTCSKQK